MRYEVLSEQAGPRVLAAVRAETTRQRLGADIVRLLDLVWPVLREQGVSTGHNVVVYYPGGEGSLTIDAGVEALTEFADRDEVRHVSTPSGEVAVTAHYGEYSAMGSAYAALESWCRDNGRRPAGVNWEVYGDWDEDPARLRTDVYVLLESVRRHLLFETARKRYITGTRTTVSNNKSSSSRKARPSGRIEPR